MNKAIPKSPSDGLSADNENPNAWRMIFGLMAPGIMVGIYTAMFSVAIPTIRTDFGIPADLAAWVTIAYTVPFVIFMPAYGRLGDALGKRRLLLIGISIFLLGTVIAGAATNLQWMIAGRVIQGLGTAGFVPLSLAIIAQRFPSHERGAVMGTWNSALPFSGLVGPVLGGLLIDSLGWRVIFWPALVLGIIALWTVRRHVPALAGYAQFEFLRKFDWGGVALLSLLMTSLFFWVSSRPLTGVPALQDWRIFVIMVVLIVAFVQWEKRRDDPFVPLSIFSYSTFTLTSVCAGIRMFAMSGIRFLVPLYLVDVHNQSAASTGLVLTAHSIPLLLLLRWGGQLADRLGSRWPVVISLAVQSLSMAYLAWLSAGATVWMVVIGVLGQSFGASLSLAALHRSSLASIPETQTGVAAGMYSMFRFAGMALGTALCGVILQQALDRALLPIEAYQASFWAVAAITTVGTILGTRLKA